MDAEFAGVRRPSPADDTDPVRSDRCGDDESAGRWTDCLGRRDWEDPTSRVKVVSLANALNTPGQDSSHCIDAALQAKSGSPQQEPQWDAAQARCKGRLTTQSEGFAARVACAPSGGYNHASNPIANVSRAPGARSMALQAQQPKNV